MKKFIIIVLLFFIYLSFVSASNYSKSDGLDWLNSNVVWGTAPIDEVSFSLLALDSNDYDITTGLGFLLSREDPSGCYPTGACTTKDTAIATLLLYNLGEDISTQLSWINQTLTKADVTGNWIIQIITNGYTGDCVFTHEQLSAPIEIEITEPLSQWVYIQSDLGIYINDPIETINVDCDLPSSTKISLLRNTGLEFYIIQEETSNNVDIVINSACYSQSPSYSTCNLDSSFYASWVLNKLNEEINTIPYLEDNLDNNLHYAMMQSINPNTNYINTLIENQNQEGYWPYTTSNIYATSFAIDSLKYESSAQTEVNNAVSWLENQQVTTGTNKGSWNNGDILDTAVALYLGLTTTAGDGFGPIYCGNDILEENEECDGTDDDACPGLCNNLCVCSSPAGECDSDLDCNIGEYCDTTTNTCKLKPDWCTVNSQCDPGEYCDTTTNTCKPAIIYCDDDDDCSFYEYCDLTENVCKASPGYCSTDADCSMGEECDQITHKCKTLEIGPEYEQEYYCDDGVDDDEDGYIDCDDSDCFEDPNCKKGGLWWIWLIIIIIILVGGGFAYFYFSKPKKPKKPSYLEPPKPFSPPSKQTTYPKPGQYKTSLKDEELEKELDRSIKEAQNLLRKK